MLGRLSMISRFSATSLPILIILSCFPGFISPAEVTLKSIEIYRTHDWFTRKPTVYFKCNSENRTILPDVKGVNVTHSFNGEESWQPLTEFSSKKCKRCGFYEKDFLTGDDLFDEWELCPSDFSAHDGDYSRMVEKEFNATFLCTDCVALAAGSPPSARSSSDNDKGGGKMNVGVIILISSAAAVVVVVGLVAGLRYWQKRKRQQEQARFLKLFEENDDMEDELGLGEGMI